jgi:DNA-binding NarL/FixJ family response regulator
VKSRNQQRQGKKKVLLVDDHPVVREGLARAINQEDDLMVCGEAGDAPHGLAAVAALRPDVVVVDISLEEGCGLDLIKDLHARTPELPTLALSMHPENLYAERAIRAGALGYVMKRQPVSDMISALRKVLGGHVAASDDILRRLVGAGRRARGDGCASPADLLSDRELEVFRLFGEGLATRDIAAKLRIALSTVQSYRAAIKQKLGLRNGTELVSRAARFVATEG